jgi:hypothetical protein
LSRGVRLYDMGCGVEYGSAGGQRPGVGAREEKPETALASRGLTQSGQRGAESIRLCRK